MIRLGDLLDLERSEHDGQWLYVKHAKSGEAYETALSPRALAVLKEIERTDERYYFAKFRRARNPRDWVGSVRQRFEYLCKKAGLALRPQAGRADVPLGDPAHGRDAVPAREGRADQRRAEARQLEASRDAAADLRGGAAR